MDHFEGTGTVAAVAKRIGRHFIHIDHSGKYCAAAAARIARITEEPVPPRRRRARDPKSGMEGGALFVRPRTLP